MCYRVFLVPTARPLSAHNKTWANNNKKWHTRQVTRDTKFARHLHTHTHTNKKTIGKEINYKQDGIIFSHVYGL